MRKQQLSHSRRGALLVAAVLLAGCQASVNGSHRLNGPPAKILVLQNSTVNPSTGDSQLTAVLSQHTTYIEITAGHNTTSPRIAGAMEPTAVYKSFARFRENALAGQIPGYARAVIYDPERWAATPLPEQRNPRAYMLRFSRLARVHGLIPILAPARDLTLVPGGSCRKRSRESLTEAYLRCGLATAVDHAAVLVVQGQVDEFNLTLYRHFIAVAARQARAVNRHVAVVAELATAPDGHPATSAQIVAAARSVAGLVAGYSLAARRTDLPTAEVVLKSFRQP